MRLDGHIRKLIDKREKIKNKENVKQHTDTIVKYEKIPKELKIDVLLPNKRFASLGDQKNIFKNLYAENVYSTIIKLDDTKKGDINKFYPMTVDKTRKYDITALNTMFIRDIQNLNSRVDVILKKKNEDLNFESININVDCDKFIPAIDAFTDLGTSNKMFNNIYSSTGIIEHADKKEYKNIRPAFGLDWIIKIGTHAYQTETGKRYHQGVDAASIDSSKFAGKIITDGNRECLRYSEFIGPIIKAIQELAQKVEKLEKRPSASLSPVPPAGPVPRLARQYSTSTISQKSDTMDFMNLQREQDRQNEKIKLIMNKMKDFEHLLNI